MKLPKPIWIFVILAGFTINCSNSALNYKSPQTGNIKTFDTATLKHDLRVLKNALIDHHPGLYRYTDTAEMNYLFDSCYRSISAPMNEADFFAVVKSLIADIKDGHAACGPSDRLSKWLENEATYFPLSIRFIGDTAFIANKQGAILNSIDGIPLTTIRKKLFQYIVSDGNIETGKNYRAGKQFGFYYLLAYGERKKFTITTTDGKTTSQEIINAVSRQELRRKEDSVTGTIINQQNWQFEIVPGNIAKITIHEFVGPEDSYRSFLESGFKKISDLKIDRLIIDLRKNGGGRDDFGSLLYSYLTNKDFRYYDYLEVTNNRNNPELLDSVGPHQFRLKDKAHPSLGILHPSPGHYQGKVWILINGLSFSATAEFCAVTRSNDRAIFVGEETGGGYYGNTSGGDFNTVLPGTLITVNIPATKYVSAVKPAAFKDRGIIPDYPVHIGISDILNNHDVVMEFTLQLISGKGRF